MNAQLTVSTSNYVGIGTTTPHDALEINGNIRGNVGGGALKINTVNGYGLFGPQGSGYCHMYTDRPCFVFNQTPISQNGDFGSFYTADLVFKTGVVYNNTAGYVRMTIKNSSGFVGINNTSPSYNLDVSGIIRANNVSINSDERLKENIKDMSGALSSLLSLKGVTYKLKSRSTNTNISNHINTFKTDTSKVFVTSQTEDTIQQNRNHIGFLAQDVQKIYPELVYSDKDGMLSVDYISLIPVLVESIKEQQMVISNLKETVEELKKKVARKQ